MGKWGSAWPLRVRLHRANSKRKYKQKRWTQRKFCLLFIFKLSKFSITLGSRQIKTSSCHVGTLNKQACKPHSVPFHNLIKKQPNCAMLWASCEKSTLPKDRIITLVSHMTPHMENKSYNKQAQLWLSQSMSEQAVFLHFLRITRLPPSHFVPLLALYKLNKHYFLTSIAMSCSGFLSFVTAIVGSHQSGGAVL